MYDRVFDRDWETLTKDEALSRAYALGVAASLGHPDPEELDRVRAAVPSAYDQSMIDLAYEEGELRARKRERDAAGDDEAVFDDLVEEGDDPFDGPIDLEPPDRYLRSPLSLAPLLERSQEEFSRLRLPGFLTRNRDR